MDKVCDAVSNATELIFDMITAPETRSSEHTCVYIPRGMDAEFRDLFASTNCCNAFIVRKHESLDENACVDVVFCERDDERNRLIHSGRTSRFVVTFEFV